VGTAVIVSWITPTAPGFSLVRYWSENSTKIRWARGTTETYRYFNYTSGYIHHANVSNLEVKFIYF
jgi:hypothetical protein